MIKFFKKSELYAVSKNHIRQRKVDNKRMDDVKKITYPTNTDQNQVGRASLVVEWLRIHLPMRRTRVQALVREDPTCHGATGPVRHSC